MKYDLIIFDCDGTLVDSEHLSNHLIATMLREVGINISDEASIEKFKGGSFNDILNFIEQQLNHKLEFNFEESFRQRSKILFEAELQAIEGVIPLLKKLNVAKCVASNGPQRKMRTTLEVTGLMSYFDKTEIFSAYDIQVWKPKPDLFLYACEKMGVAPSKALVIEDTITGGLAAQNAGIDLIIYSPENDEEFSKAGMETFSDYKEIDNFLFSSNT